MSNRIQGTRHLGMPQGASNGAAPMRWILTTGELPAKSRATGSSPDGRSAGESALLTWPSRCHPWGPQARATRPAPAVAASPPDWGLGSRWPGDWAANDRALADGERLLSAYVTDAGTKVWIITEWDRSATTVLLPEEY